MTGIEIQPHDPEKRAAHMAKVEEAQKGRQEVLDDLMETGVKRKTVVPVEYESTASAEANDIIAGMKYQMFGTPPEPAAEEKTEAATPDNALKALIDEHGIEWAMEHLTNRHLATTDEEDVD